MKSRQRAQSGVAKPSRNATKRGTNSSSSLTSCSIDRPHRYIYCLYFSTSNAVQAAFHTDRPPSAG
nr:uncharacterized protein CTRU02_05189 [Colletotrichum truncatum]KAF6794357.1 hypothetical protein CTRU02_05189 [Colletotrichum truncatum]